ncbi:unnamed protein product [Pleuronectes platessa]|uniref:Uncharacterized protein n=1 Tax=Pleuronectes platessa TaxID=8262 RepID=A0A9N7VEJ1_PLEPL|nr:unnamed protein product [Pleuronectes platessa]
MEPGPGDQTTDLLCDPSHLSEQLQENFALTTISVPAVEICQCSFSLIIPNGKKMHPTNMAPRRTLEEQGPGLQLTGQRDRSGHDDDSLSTPPGALCEQTSVQINNWTLQRGGSRKELYRCSEDGSSLDFGQGRTGAARRHMGHLDFQHFSPHPRVIDSDRPSAASRARREYFSHATRSEDFSARTPLTSSVIVWLTSRKCSRPDVMNKEANGVRARAAPHRDASFQRQEAGHGDMVKSAYLTLITLPWMETRQELNTSPASEGREKHP